MSLSYTTKAYGRLVVEKLRQYGITVCFLCYVALLCSSLAYLVAETKMINMILLYKKIGNMPLQTLSDQDSDQDFSSILAGIEHQTQKRPNANQNNYGDAYMIWNDDQHWSDFMPATVAEVDPDYILQCFTSMKEGIEMISDNIWYSRSQPSDAQSTTSSTSFSRKMSDTHNYGSRDDRMPLSTSTTAEGIRRAARKKRWKRRRSAYRVHKKKMGKHKSGVQADVMVDQDPHMFPTDYIHEFTDDNLSPIVINADILTRMDKYERTDPDDRPNKFRVQRKKDDKYRTKKVDTIQDFLHYPIIQSKNNGPITLKSIRMLKSLNNLRVNERFGSVLLLPDTNSITSFPTSEAERKREIRLGFLELFDKYKLAMTAETGLLFWDTYKPINPTTPVPQFHHQTILLEFKKIFEKFFEPRETRLLVSNLFEVNGQYNYENDQSTFTKFERLLEYVRPTDIYARYFGNPKGFETLLTELGEDGSSGNTTGYPSILDSQSFDYDPAKTGDMMNLRYNYIVITIESSFHKLGFIPDAETIRQTHANKLYTNTISSGTDPLSDAILLVQFWCMLNEEGLLFLNIPIAMNDEFPMTNPQILAVLKADDKGPVAETVEELLKALPSMAVWASHRVYSLWRIRNVILHSPSYWDLIDIIDGEANDDRTGSAAERVPNLHTKGQEKLIRIVTNKIFVLKKMIPRDYE